MIASLSGTKPNLAFLFCSHHYDVEELVASLAQHVEQDKLVGCTGEAIVIDEKEHEEEPTVSLLCGWLPQNQVKTMHLRLEKTPDGSTIVGWPDELPAEWPETSSLIVLGEPYSFPMDYLLQRINDDQPGRVAVGGMASGGMGPGMNRLVLGDKIIEEGAVAIWIDGDVQVEPVVSQGCRGIGQTFVVTRAERNIVLELGGKPALNQLQSVFANAPNHEQQLMQQGLQLGLVVDERQSEYTEFLIRNVAGIDEETEGVVIGDYAKVGQTVRFHVRDEESADADLKRSLQHAAKNEGSALGGLLFTCNGRGTRLFTDSDHDASLIRQTFDGLPVAGLFAQGEVGPIGSENFLHGFTASVALFRERSSTEG